MDLGVLIVYIFYSAICTILHKTHLLYYMVQCKQNVRVIFMQTVILKIYVTKRACLVALEFNIYII